MAITATILSGEECAAHHGPLRVVWIIVPPVIVALWVLALILTWRRTEAAGRPRLLPIFAVGLAGGIFNFVPDVEGGGHHHLYRFLLVLGVTALVGIALGLRSRAVGALRGGWVAVTGNVVPLGAPLLLFVWFLALFGQC